MLQESGQQHGGSTGNRTRAAAWDGLPWSLCVMCVSFSPLLALFIFKMNAHYFEDQWSSNPCRHIVVFSCWVSAGSTGPA